MKPSKQNKRSLYIPEKYLTEMKAEAKRQDRSLSWIVQQAWKIAYNDLKLLPTANILYTNKSNHTN